MISSKIAREVFEHMWAGEGAPAAIVEARGLRQVTDTGALEAMIDELIAANPDQAEAVKTKPQAIGWFVGQVMSETGGKANPAAVNEILKAKLGVGLRGRGGDTRRRRDGPRLPAEPGLRGQPRVLRGARVSQAARRATWPSSPSAPAGSYCSATTTPAGPRTA